LKTTQSLPKKSKGELQRFRTKVASMAISVLDLAVLEKLRQTRNLVLKKKSGTVQKFFSVTKSQTLRADWITKRNKAFSLL